MNKEQFISRLDELLKDIPESERAEAIEYYREYFDDAGVENEEQVIGELGSPEKVAHNIKEELAGKELMTVDSFTGGKSGSGSGEEYAAEEKFSGQGEETAGRNTHNKAAETVKRKNPVVVALLAILAFFLAVVAGVPVLGSVGGCVIGLAAAFFGILLAVWIVGIVFVALAPVMLVLAVANIFTSVVVSLALLGLAFFFFGSGLLLILIGLKLCTVVIPAVVRAIADLFHRLIYRKEQSA